MKVGVRFCGGCNPMYDRGDFYKRVKEANPKRHFYLAEECQKYDYLLVIGGCSSCCASYQQYTFDKLIKVWEPDHGLNIE